MKGKGAWTIPNGPFFQNETGQQHAHCSMPAMSNNTFNATTTSVTTSNNIGGCGGGGGTIMNEIGHSGSGSPKQDWTLY